MGIVSSKVGQEDNEEITTGSLPSTPILTPKHKKTMEDILDPRSPSLNIIRTPITSCSSPFTPEENPCDTFNINSPVLIKNIEDPRSPTLAFTRTPITAVEDTCLLRKVHKKNLDNIKKVIGEMPSQIPPKLLESSPIKPKQNENKRKSFFGLLETNLDFVETDLDAVILSKSSPSTVKYISPKAKKEMTEKFLSSPNKDCRNKFESQDLQVVTIQPEDKEETKELNVSEVCDKIENVQVSVDEDDDGLLIIDPPPLFAGNAFEEVQTEEILGNILPETIEVLSQEPEDVNFVPEIVDMTPKKENEITTVQEFENQVNKLIYTENDHIIQSPKENKLKEGNNRAPLRARNGNHTHLSKSKPKLRVSDKPRRSEYATSRIPVFKTKHGSCENTPPSKHLTNARKARRAQWDSDNTLII